MTDASSLAVWLRGHGRPIAPSTWTSYVARGQAPAPRRHVGRTPLWDLSDIEAWIAAQRDARDVR